MGKGLGKPFEISPKGLDRTAWQATHSQFGNQRTIIFKEENNLLKAYYSTGASSSWQEDLIEFILQEMIGYSYYYLISKFIDNEAHFTTDTGDKGVFKFKNSTQAELSYINEWGNEEGIFHLQRILPYPDLSSKSPAWTIDTLDGQKWIYSSGGVLTNIL